MLMWMLTYLGIALAGLVMVICFALWLWRKATRLLDESSVLLGRVAEAAEILEQIGAPVDRLPQDPHSSRAENDVVICAGDEEPDRPRAT